MVEASELIQPAMSFLGGAFGARAIWSWRAKKERRELKLQIKERLQEAEPVLIKVYDAISNRDHTAGLDAQGSLDKLGRELCVRLERYALVHELSDRSSEHITKLVPLTQLFELLGRFARNYTSTSTSGKQSFIDLWKAGAELDASVKSTPDAVNKLRKKFDLPKLSDEVRNAHEKALDAVEQNRKALDSNDTVGRDIFLEDNR